MSDNDDLKRPTFLLRRPFTMEMAAAFRRLGYDVVHSDEPGRTPEEDDARLLISSPEAARGHGGASLQIRSAPSQHQLLDALARALKSMFVNDAGQIYVYEDGQPLVVPILDPAPPLSPPRPRPKAKPRRPLS